jgi:hypothetical protein
MRRGIDLACFGIVLEAAGASALEAPGGNQEFKRLFG